MQDYARKSGLHSLLLNQLIKVKHMMIRILVKIIIVNFANISMVQIVHTAKYAKSLKIYIIK